MEQTQKGQPEAAAAVAPESAAGADQVSTMEQSLAERQSEITALRQAGEALSAELRSMGDGLKKAVAGYRQLLVEANPAIPTELIDGDSVEALSDSVRKARAMVDKIKEGIRAEASLEHVPTGAPERRTTQGEMSAREKIEQGIRRA